VPPPAPTWTITASELQLLWGEIFPRIVGLAWLFNCPNPFPTGPIQGLLGNRLIAYRNWLIGDPSPPTTAIDDFNETLFGKRMKRVSDYLGTAGSAAMPIRYHGVGAFDFVLSDYGIDLFAPPGPPSQLELLRYYQFRNTGRSTIGIPTYLDRAKDLAFEVQSPAGPSQVWTDQNGLNASISGDQCTLGDLECLDDPLQRYVAPDPPALEDLRTRFRDLKKNPDLVDYLQPLFRSFTPVRNFTIQGYYAATTRLRCWQLEGSVYRGILEQLPRVVATVWREQGMNCASGSSYADRFGNPRAMRGIFEERLETTLPAYDDMVFEVGSRPGDPPLLDVEISNQGIRFPEAGAAPAVERMFEAIATGAAGNPVFTDTRRPPRDE
jgi:hypothetical protein